MTLEMAIHMGQQLIWSVIIIAGPVLLTALLVGSVVSVFQAVSQIQEITLVFVPKIIAVFLVVALAGGWMINMAVTYGVQSFESISETDR